MFYKLAPCHLCDRARSSEMGNLSHRAGPGRPLSGASMSAVKHIGLVVCSAEGASLCYRTLGAEGAAVLGPHARRWELILVVSDSDFCTSGT